MSKTNTVNQLVEVENINVFNQEEIDHFCKVLKCTELDLRWAVSCVGGSFVSVDAFLSMNHRKSIK